MAKIIKKNMFHRLSCSAPVIARVAGVRYKSLTSSKEINTHESYFPKVKPEFPEGTWTGLKQNDVWKRHEECNNLTSILKVKDRLEYISAEQNQTMYIVDAYDKIPGMLKFKEFITKSFLINDALNESGMPLSYTGTKVNDDNVNLAKEVLADRVLQVSKNKLDNGTLNNTRSSELLTNYLGLLSAVFCKEFPHLYKSQFDEDVRIETFWDVDGYKDIAKKCQEHSSSSTHQTGDEKQAICSCANFQIVARMSQQIRVPNPLPPVSFL